MNLNCSQHTADAHRDQQRRAAHPLDMDQMPPLAQRGYAAAPEGGQLHKKEKEFGMSVF